MLRVTRDDHLSIRRAGFGTAKQFIVGARIETTAGMKYLRQLVDASTDFSLNDFQLPLIDGVLTAIAVKCTSGFGAFEASYIEVNIQPGRVSDSDPPWIGLLAGYIIGEEVMSWPARRPQGALEGAGFTRVYTPADPAAGANLSLTFDAHLWTRVEAMNFDFVTSATAATRVPTIVLSDGAQDVSLSRSTGTVTASTTAIIGAQIGSNDGNTSANSRLHIGLPDVRLPPSGSIATSILSLQAGDQISDVGIICRHWLHPLDT